MTNLDSILKNRDKEQTLLADFLYNQSYGFSGSYVKMWELECNEGWAPKNCCFWTAVLEKTFESPLDSKEIKAAHPKGNQSWIFLRSTDSEAETPKLWPPDGKSQLIRKHPDAGKERRQEENGTAEDDGRMASLTQLTWVWVSSRRWRTGKPGVLQSMASQRVGPDWATKQQCPPLYSTFRWWLWH